MNAKTCSAGNFQPLQTERVTGRSTFKLTRNSMQWRLAGGNNHLKISKLHQPLGFDARSTATVRIRTSLLVDDLQIAEWRNTVWNAKDGVNFKEISSLRLEKVRSPPDQLCPSIFEAEILIHLFHLPDNRFWQQLFPSRLEAVGINS